MDTDKRNDSVLYDREAVYQVNKEYDRLRDELMKDPEVWKKKKCQYTQKKFHSYMENLGHVCSEFSREYAHRMSREFCRAAELDELSIDFFTQEEWDCITLLRGDWYAFYCRYYLVGHREKELEEKLRYAQEELKQCRKKLGVQQRALFEYESSQELKLGRRCMRVVNFIKKITARIRRKQG